MSSKDSTTSLSNKIQKATEKHPSLLKQKKQATIKRLQTERVKTKLAMGQLKSLRTNHTPKIVLGAQ